MPSSSLGAGWFVVFSPLIVLVVIFIATTVILGSKLIKTGAIDMESIRRE